MHFSGPSLFTCDGDDCKRKNKRDFNVLVKERGVHVHGVQFSKRVLKGNLIGFDEGHKKERSVSAKKNHL